MPVEPLENQVPGPEQSQAPAEERPLESSESTEATGAGQDQSGEKKLPSPRPARLRVLPPSLGYGAFRRQLSTGPDPPSPSPASVEQPRDGEAAGAELVPWTAPGEPAPGTWAPMELQVDVRVKPVTAAGGSCAPSPAPSRRFITVPVPESPAFSRHASPVHPLLRTASSGSTWSRGSPLAAAAAEHGLGTEGRASPAEGGKESPGSPTCRCKEQEREEDTVLLHCEELAGGEKLHRAIKLMGLPMYIKCLHWALVVMAVLLAVSAVANVVLASRTGAGWQRPCPQGWLWSGEHCYYFSTEAQAWEASQAFCSAHQATLPLLSHTQDFLARYPVIKYSWVGAVMGPEGWHWIDGTIQRLPEENDDQPVPKCGSLEGGKLVALDCTSSRPWICAKGTK